MTYAAIASLPALLLAALFVCAKYSRLRLRDLHHYRIHSEQFYEAAKPLVQDDDTPEEVLKFLSFLNRRVVDKAGSKTLYHLLSSGQMDAFSGSVQQEAHRMREFLDARPELEKPFISAMVHALAAMTFLSAFYGPKVRLLLSTVRSKEDRENIAVAYETLSHDSDARVRHLRPAMC